MSVSPYLDIYSVLGDRYFKETLLVSGLGRQKIILGLPWLTEHNPDINWKTGVVKW